MNRALLFFVSLIVISCDDGDIIVDEFDFDDTGVNSCTAIVDENIFDYVFYKNKTDTQEAFILSFSSSENISQEGDYAVTNIGTSNTFEYRKFNASAAADYFCDRVPPVSPRVTENFQGTAETLNITTILSIEDDKDGIPAELEGIVYNEDGTVNDAASLDSDGDGIPDYKDPDDDGDNVATVDERVFITDGVIDLILSRNTDQDLEIENNVEPILDYLDSDDDGDGIDTRQEVTLDDINPINNENEDGTPAYLDRSSKESAPEEIIENVPLSFFRTFTSQFIFQNLVLTDGSEEFVFDTYDFGTFTYPDIEIPLL